MVVGKKVSEVAGAKDAVLSTELCASYRECAPLLVIQQPSTCVGGTVLAAVAGRYVFDIYRQPMDTVESSL